MKKYLIFLTIFLISFFSIKNVKAATNLGKVFIDENVLNNSIVQINNYNGSNENMIIYKNQLLEYMNIQEDEDYFIYINYSYKTIDGYKWKKTTEWEKEPGLYLGTINTSKDYIYGNFQINFNAYVKNENKLINSYKIYYENTSSYNMGTKMKNSDTYYIQKYDPFLKGNFQSDKESGNNNYIVDEEYTFVNEFLNHYYESSIDIKLTYNNDKIARSKLDYYFDELGITNEEEKIDITSYKLGDILFDSSGSNTWGENNIKFNDSINTEDISRIEIEFKIPSNDFNFEFKGFLLTNNYGLSEPFIESRQYLYDEEKEITRIERNNNDWYYPYPEDQELKNYKKLDFEYILGINEGVSLKYIIDVYDYSDILAINFSTNINFEIKYYYKQEESNYYKIIEMNDIKGLYLIPKVIDSDIISNIYTFGNYKVSFYDIKDNQNWKELEVKELSDGKGSIQKKFNYNDYYKMLYIENKNYNTKEDNDYYIKFDTRYYNHSIKEDEFSNVEITNPNTNETITINWDSQEKEKDLNSFIDYIKKIFNSKSFSESFSNVYELIRQSSIGIYIFIIIVSSIVILVIKSMK